MACFSVMQAVLPEPGAEGSGRSHSLCSSSLASPVVNTKCDSPLREQAGVRVTVCLVNSVVCPEGRLSISPADLGGRREHQALKHTRQNLASTLV